MFVWLSLCECAFVNHSWKRNVISTFSYFVYFDLQLPCSFAISMVCYASLYAIRVKCMSLEAFVCPIQSYIIASHSLRSSFSNTLTHTFKTIIYLIWISFRFFFILKKHAQTFPCRYFCLFFWLVLCYLHFSNTQNEIKAMRLKKICNTQIKCECHEKWSRAFRFCCCCGCCNTEPKKRKRETGTRWDKKSVCVCVFSMVTTFTNCA